MRYSFDYDKITCCGDCPLHNEFFQFCTIDDDPDSVEHFHGMTFNGDGRPDFCNLKGHDELKPCPFCGGEAHIITAVGESWVRCDKCRATTEAYTDEQLTIAAWNRRAKV